MTAGKLYILLVAFWNPFPKSDQVQNFAPEGCHGLFNGRLIGTQEVGLPNKVNVAWLEPG